MILLILLAAMIQEPGRDAATFVQRANEFERRDAELRKAVMPETRASATLEWLRALSNVLHAIPIARASGPHEAWLKSHEDVIVYDEPGGQWLIQHNLLLRLQDELKNSAVADDIAWLMVTNGLPGECEGYFPCYAARMDALDGEYLRRHPSGQHRAEVFTLLDELLHGIVDELLKPPIPKDYLSVPEDCGDLLRSMRPLRAAVAGAGGSSAGRIAMIDRIIGLCPR